MTDRGSTIDARETAGDLFAVACPACGKSLAAAVRDAGRVAKCPCCRARLLLPPLPTGAMPGEMPGEMPQAAVVRAPEPAPVVVTHAPLPASAEPLPTFELPAHLVAGQEAAGTTVAASDIGPGPDGAAVLAMTRRRRERDRRRSRRSLLMLLIGSVILLGIVFAFTSRTRR
jgi:hypothetical protein